MSPRANAKGDASPRANAKGDASPRANALGRGLDGAAVAAVARRPDLWPVAISTARSLVPRAWWRRRPFLPLPDNSWMHFRLETAYGGDGDGPIEVEDLITFLEWKRAFPA